MVLGKNLPNHFSEARLLGQFQLEDPRVHLPNPVGVLFHELRSILFDALVVSSPFASLLFVL